MRILSPKVPKHFRMGSSGKVGVGVSYKTNGQKREAMKKAGGIPDRTGLINQSQVQEHTGELDGSFETI